MGYKIEKYPHGVLIYGFLTTDELVTFCKVFKRLHKIDLLDTSGIAQRYGASFCLVNEKGHEAWMEELGIKPIEKGG
jgi:hypothetical protein